MGGSAVLTLLVKFPQAAASVRGVVLSCPVVQVADSVRPTP